MIKFGENNKVENIGILTEEEARAYIDFLFIERLRHIGDIEHAQVSADIEISWADKSQKYSDALVKFYQSAIKRHEEDIKAIDVLVTTLKGFYGIK